MTSYNIMNQLPFVIWILDVNTQQYLFISDNTFDYFGYNVDNYIKKGQDFHNQIRHPEDRLTTEKILAKVWDTLSNIPQENKANYRFSLDYRIQKPDKTIVRILEHNTVLQQDSSGNITHLLGVCSNITHWKKEDSQLASLTSSPDKKSFLFTPDNVSPIKPKTTLSKRELEIVRLLAEGHSSKLIADKLFISFHTVNTHRQKMIEKTNTKNTGGLVQFAAFNGLI